MSDFTGRYDLVSHERYGDYLKAIGVGMITRTLAEKSKPTIEFSEMGGRYTIRRITAQGTKEIVFTSGEEFDEKLDNGRQGESVINVEKSSLTYSTTDGANKYTSRWDFDSVTLKIVYTALDVTAIEVYKAL